MTCQHNWHFIEGTERLRCERCKVETGPKSPEQRVQDMLKDVITMGSAWSKGGERIDPMTVYKDFEPWTTEHLTVPAGQHLSIGNIKPSYSLTFHNNLDTGGTGKQVGKLDFNGPELVFEGDAAESAHVFFDYLANYFRGRLAEERQKELDACCDLLEGMHVASTGSHNYYLHAANELRKLRGKA